MAGQEADGSKFHYSNQLYPCPEDGGIVEKGTRGLHMKLEAYGGRGPMDIELYYGNLKNKAII